MKLRHGKFKLEIKQNDHLARLYLNNEYVALIRLDENGSVIIIPMASSILDLHVSLEIKKLGVDAR